MRKKSVFLSVFFGFIVLAALSLQSAHAIHHIDELFKEKKCRHNTTISTTEITHSHHKTDHCFVCEFTFNTSITPSFFLIEFKKINYLKLFSFANSIEIVPFFKGSLFALRAPPRFIA